MKKLLVKIKKIFLLLALELFKIQIEVMSLYQQNIQIKELTDTCDHDERGDMSAIAVSHKITINHQSSDMMRNQAKGRQFLAFV